MKNSALEKYRIDKLQAETDFINQKTIEKKNIIKRLELENEPKRVTVGEKVKKTISLWSSIIGFIVAIIGLLAGYFRLVPDYVEFKDALLIKNKVSLNSEMLDLIDKLDSSATREQSAMLLSYYGKNSIPILFYKLENIREEDVSHISNSIMQTITFSQDTGDMNKYIIEKAKARLLYLFDSQKKETKPDDMNFKSCINYVLLLRDIGDTNSLKDLHKHFSESNIDHKDVKKLVSLTSK
ncbi:MAG: hypothetical protein ACK47E_09155 [Cyclobacteriaceae bacterium]